MRDEHDDTRDDALSALYAQTRTPEHTPEPSAAAESRILAAARDAAAAPPVRHAAYLRWAGAAVFVLAVGMAWRGLQPGTDAPVAAKMASPPATALRAADAAREARSEVIQDLANGAMTASSPPAGLAAAALPAPAADAEAEATTGRAPQQAADPRLDPVRALVVEGRREEARRALEALMAGESPPALDEALRALLYDEQPPSPARAAESPELQR